MFQSVPEVEDFATSHKQGGTIPDPFRSIAHDHHHGVSPHPAQLAQLRAQADEDGIRISQASHQKPAHHRASSG
jgi:hypothetical protein